MPTIIRERSKLSRDSKTFLLVSQKYRRMVVIMIRLYEGMRRGTQG